jgi:hypothetical protein
VAHLLANLQEEGALLDIGTFLRDKSDEISPQEAMSGRVDGRLYENGSPPLDMSRVHGPYSTSMDDIVATHQRALSQPSSVAGGHSVNPNWSPGIENGGHVGFPFSNDITAGGMLGETESNGKGSSNSGRPQFRLSRFGLSSNNEDDWLSNQMNRDGNLGFPLWNNIAQQSEHSTVAQNGTQYTLGTPDASRIASPHNGGSLALSGASRHNGHALGSPSRQHVPSMPVEEIVEVVLSYLPMMVSREPPTPPFIHDQIYRCSDGDVKEPIARAMVCINANRGAMPSGRRFVYDMINRERDGLIKSFVSCSPPDVLVSSWSSAR